MKKFVSMLLLVSLMFTVFAAAGQAAEKVPKLFLNGKVLESSVSPKVVNETMIVPLRIISEGLGYHVGWDGPTKTATVDNNVDVIKLKLNDSVALVNGKQVQMLAPALEEGGRTLVPLRFISEQMGKNV